MKIQRLPFTYGLTAKTRAIGAIRARANAEDLPPCSHDYAASPKPAEPGTGKTTTASGLLNAYLTAHYVGSLKRGQTPKERPVFFLDVNEWQTHYNRYTRPGVPDWRKEEAADVMEVYGPDEIIAEHIERYCGTTLNKLTTAELARALFVGYTVELTEAEKPLVEDNSRVHDAELSEHGHLSITMDAHGSWSENSIATNHAFWALEAIHEAYELDDNS